MLYSWVAHVFRQILIWWYEVMENSFPLLERSTSYKQVWEAGKGQGQEQREGNNTGVRDKIQLLENKSVDSLRGHNLKIIFLAK